MTALLSVSGDPNNHNPTAKWAPFYIACNGDVYNSYLEGSNHDRGLSRVYFDMRNFGLGLALGVILAACAYKPYEIEAKYQRNVEHGIAIKPLAPCDIRPVQ
jgi:hypothetical protein